MRKIRAITKEKIFIFVSAKTKVIQTSVCKLKICFAHKFQKKNGIKKIKYIIWGYLVFWCVFYIMPASLLSIPLVQKKISKIASEELHAVLGVPVNIGQVNFELFNKLVIKDLYLEDQQKEVLFQAKRLSAGFDFWPLFKGKIRFSSVQLFSFQFNLTKQDDDSPLNIQFVIDAFASKDSVKKENNIDLVIRNLNLQRGIFTFNVQNAPETQGKFNAKHLNIKDISSKIQIKKLTNSELIAEIDRLSFKEQSGFTIRRIALGLDFSKDSAAIKKLEILLPCSSLTVENILADFREVSESGDYINHSHISMQILLSEICLQDLSAFVPAFGNYKDLLNIQGEVSGKINRLELNDFLLRDEDKLLLHANMLAENLTNGEDVFVSGIVKKSFISANEIAKIVNNLSEKPANFPEQILRLGNIRFEGEMSGHFHHLTAYGLFDTDIGSIRTDILIGKNHTNFIKGEVKSQNIDLKKFFLNDDYGITNFKIQVDAQQNRNNQYEGTVNARINSIEYKHYAYENIDLKGNFTEKSFDGTLDIDNPEARLMSKGLVLFDRSKSVFNFSAKVEHIKLDRLNLSKKYKNSDLSFNLNVDLTGNNMDNVSGCIDLRNVRFIAEKGEYSLDSLTVSSRTTETNDKLLNIKSDFLNGTVIGNYSIDDIVPALQETGNHLLPVFVKAPQKKVTSENDFKIDVSIHDMEQLANIFDLPFVLYDETRIQGDYRHETGKFNLEISSPKCYVNNMQLKDCYVKLKNKDDREALLLVNATQMKNDKTNKIAAVIDISEDMIHSKLKWNDKLDHYNGFFNVSAKFTEQQGAFPLKTEINFLESKVTFKDSVWNIHPSQIIMDSAKIKINHLFANHSDQFVKINGIISEYPQDSLWVDLNKVSLDYIFDILSIRTFEMGGIVSGHATANDIFHTRELSTRLNVENFSFNKSVVGNLTLLGIWDDEKKGIQLLGDIYKNDSSRMKVDGMIFPIKEALDLKFKAKNVNAAFLRRYLNNVVKDISGLISGDVNLFGDFSDVTLAGDVFVKDGSFGIDFLNTTYFFSDYVYLKPDEIAIKNATFYDKFKNKATVNGSVKHKFLEDFVFSANVNTNNFLVFNATEQKNPLFFGSAFGTGSLSIKGNENQVDFDLKMRTDERTKITLNFMEQRDVAEYNFINFVSKKDSDPTTLDKIFSQFTNKPIYIRSESGTDLNFNLQLTATPDATIELIMDPVSGDKIKGYGQGPVNIRYGTNSALKLYGKYILEKGTYNFSFQQALYRDFQIREGSSIAFNGDPYTATLDIDAIYSLSANISDLSENLAQEASRMNLPVNCVLKITGALERPDIKFDIEAPNSDENIERQIKALINTEEMMNRQIIYLLVLNKFYTVETGNNTSTQRNNDFSSLAASTLSSQLTSLLGSLSENLQIGAVYTTNNSNVFTDTEMALMLSSQLLNNRLIFNGNFGYRDSPATNTSFIGDFDAEYKLTKAGDIRLKAYNHYNDRYYSLRSAYTTQGFGVLYRKDFNNFRYIFRKKQL